MAYGVKAQQLNVVTAPKFSPESKTWSIGHTSLPATTGLNYAPAIARDPKWLGFNHDGYSVVPLTHYRVTRGTQIPMEFNREHAAFVQAWLSFGLLEAVLEHPVPEKTLVCQSRDGRPVLSLHALPALLSSWKSQLSTHDRASILSYRERTVKTLSHAHRTLQHLKSARAFEYDGAISDGIPATFCLLGCIGESLTNAVQFLNSNLDEEFHFNLPWDFVLAFYPLSSPNYQPIMSPDHPLDDEEWCPSTVRYLIKRSNVSAFRYALRRGPRNRGETHDRCSEYVCLLQSVDVNNYVPKHTGTLKDKDTCDCAYIKPPLENVTGILSTGSIPVIRLPDGNEVAASGEKLAVSLSSDAPYIAISHVWIDGMGSDTETGLPACQVWKLAAFAQSMVPSGRFWVDALCVPAQRDARQRALKLMGRAYRDAEAVVVRDQTIEACSQDASSAELLLRILTAPWMRRLWTLQEAMLARRLFFVLSDGVVPFHGILPDADRLLTDPVLAGFAAEIHRLTKLRPHRNSLAFADVARALRWRATSRPSDEIPAIVSLLLNDEDARRVLDAPAERKVESLFTAVGKVPKSVVFLSGPKLPTVGFRWAPATFMTVATGQEKGGRDFIGASPSSIVTPDGLVDEFWVFEIHSTVREFAGAEGERWMFQCGVNEEFAVTRMRMETGLYRCNFLLCIGPEPPEAEQQLCLGVCGSVEKRVNGEERVLHCVYGTKLVITKSPRGRDSEDHEEAPFGASSLGMMKVCIS